MEEIDQDRIQDALGEVARDKRVGDGSCFERTLPHPAATDPPAVDVHPPHALSSNSLLAKQGTNLKAKRTPGDTRHFDALALLTVFRIFIDVRTVTSALRACWPVAIRHLRLPLSLRNLCCTLLLCLPGHLRSA